MGGNHDHPGPQKDTGLFDFFGLAKGRAPCSASRGRANTIWN